jgi:hypothetical protein
MRQCRTSGSVKGVITDGQSYSDRDDGLCAASTNVVLSAAYLPSASYRVLTPLLAILP